MHTYIFLLITLCMAPCILKAKPTYSWLNHRSTTNINRDQLLKRISVPPHFKRIPTRPNSFAEFLRYLPLKPGVPSVYLHNGNLKLNQLAQYAVINIDTGKRNLQQCADAVMRLRAEYLYSVKKTDHISFRFTDGVPARYTKWRAGFRPKIRKRGTLWHKMRPADHSYKSFRQYLNTVFAYAGTWSLAQESKNISLNQMQIGDFFIKGGFPGHAIIVVDMALNSTTGEKRFLLAQSFMPAQDMHILKNPTSKSPWYKIPMSILYTPEWNFKTNSLHRF